MASQTGSIDLTASNSVKLAAEAGWQSELEENYYTSAEIDLTVEGINSDVTEIVDGLTQSSHFTQTADGFSFTLDDALEDAEKVATNYATDITGGGVMIHPSDDATSGVRITDDVDIMRDGTSVINIGTNNAVHIGVDDSTHVKMLLESGGLTIENEDGSEIFAVESNASGTTIRPTTASFSPWTAIADVIAGPYVVTDSAAVVDLDNPATASVTISDADAGGTYYVLDSTHATVSVTAGTGVSVTLTSDGVSYVQSLMEGDDATNVKPATLSIDYSHTVADSASLTFDGYQTICGAGNNMLVLKNDEWSNSSKSGTFLKVANESTNKAVLLGVGSGGVNRGVFDVVANTWIIYRNEDNNTIIPGKKFSVAADGATVMSGLRQQNFSKVGTYRPSGSDVFTFTYYNTRDKNGTQIGYANVSATSNRIYRSLAVQNPKTNKTAAIYVNSFDDGTLSLTYTSGMTLHATSVDPLSCMTAAISGQTDKSLTTSYANLTLSAVTTVGSDLSIASGGVKCERAGKVMLSASAYFSGFSDANVCNLRILIGTTVAAWVNNRATGAAVSDRCQLTIPSRITTVSAGDILYMAVANTSTAAGIVEGTRTQTWLTVQYVS